MQFMVTFLKDCFTAQTDALNLEDALKGGIQALPKLRPPEVALKRLEQALWGLASKAGGEAELKELATFWNHIETGDLKEAMQPLKQRASVGIMETLVSMDARVPPAVRDVLSELKSGDGSLNVDEAMDKAMNFLNSDQVSEFEFN